MSIETQGTLIQRGDGATPSENFSTIGEVVDFDGPGGQASVIDATHLNSAAKEKRMGLADEGQFTFNLNFEPSDAVQNALREDRRTRVARKFKIIYTDTAQTTWDFTAYVLNFRTSGGVDDLVRGSVTLEITGPVMES
jgi:hypothetical protein